MKSFRLDPGYSYLLFFGLIRAFAHERLKQYPLKFVIAGEYYTDAKPYKELIEKHKLHDRVIEHNDFIPYHAVADYLCAADLIVQPYEDAPQSGFMQIAYHFNKSMLVTDLGGLAEIVPYGKGGNVVKPDPVEIAAGIEDFF